MSLMEKQQQTHFHGKNFRHPWKLTSGKRNSCYLTTILSKKGWELTLPKIVLWGVKANRYSTQSNVDLQGSYSSALISFLRLRCMSVWIDARPWALIFFNSFAEGSRPQTSSKSTYPISCKSLMNSLHPRSQKKIVNKLLVGTFPISDKVQVLIRYTCT